MKKRRSNIPAQKRRRRAGRKVFPQFVGRVQMTREGFIFVIIDGKDEDVFVRAAKTRHALDGDTVRVAVTRQGGRDNRQEGEVVEIIERSRRQFIGYFHMVGAQAWVLMQSKFMPYDIEVDPEPALAMGAKPGFKVAAVVDRWDRGDNAPVGRVVDVLGEPGDNDTEMHAILSEFNLPYRFENEVEDAADAISEKIGPAELKGRRDFRDVLTFTIDPSDAKDFDDALSFRQLPGGNFEVGVHIADVSWYVRPDDIVDKEARARGTSVYLVDRTVPMLPEKLCNKLCSLRQDEEKLTFSAVFEMTPSGEVVNKWLGRTVIRSNSRLNYDQAQAIISAAAQGVPQENRATPGINKVAAATRPARDFACKVGKGLRPRGSGGVPPIIKSGGAERSETFSAAAPCAAAGSVEEAVLKTYELAMILRDRRFAAGAINFDRPEMKVEVDEKGRPVRVYQHLSCEANWLVEEFMLLANRTVAEFVATGGKMNGHADKNPKTFVYRVHGDPNFEKMGRLATFASGFGYKMKDISDGKAAAAALRSLLMEAKGKPEFSAFENLALRSMAKAVYSTDNIGHYGLAFRFYTHFTSPIRRYPDLMVHRLLAAYLDGADSRNREKFEGECKYASERETLAQDAERTSIKYKLVEFMQDKIGQEFAGNVSGMTERGMYVEIADTKVEGMIPLREIRSDFYDFDEEHYRLVGRRTHGIFRLGDEVRIRVKKANLEQRLLDYELVENLDDTKPVPAPRRHGEAETHLKKSSWKRSKIVKSEA